MRIIQKLFDHGWFSMYVEGKGAGGSSARKYEQSLIKTH